MLTKLLFTILLLVSIGFNVAAYNEVQNYPEELKTLQYSLDETTKLYHDTLKELKKYQATEQWLIELGAPSEEAKETIKAAEAYRLDPKF